MVAGMVRTQPEHVPEDQPAEAVQALGRSPARNRGCHDLRGLMGPPTVAAGAWARHCRVRLGVSRTARNPTSGSSGSQTSRAAATPPRARRQ